MNSSNNLIVALLALWCYAHNSSINLANNTTFLLTLYALLTYSNRHNNQGGGNPQRPLPFPNNNNGNVPGNQPPFGVPFNNAFAQPNSGGPFPNNNFGPTFF